MTQEQTSWEHKNANLVKRCRSREVIVFTRKKCHSREAVALGSCPLGRCDCISTYYLTYIDVFFLHCRNDFPNDKVICIAKVLQHAAFLIPS